MKDITKPPIKFYPRLNRYKASNLEIDAKTLRGTSYGWYEIIKKLGNTVVLNPYIYSNATAKHVYKVQRLLDFLNIKYIEIEAPKGLQNLTLSIELYKQRIDTLVDLINKPRSHKKTNIDRQVEISKLEQKIKTVRALIAKEK